MVDNDTRTWALAGRIFASTGCKFGLTRAVYIASIVSITSDLDGKIGELRTVGRFWRHGKVPDTVGWMFETGLFAFSSLKVCNVDS